MKSRARRQANAPDGNENWQHSRPPFRHQRPSQWHRTPLCPNLPLFRQRLRYRAAGFTVARMNAAQLLRLSGASAVAGGALRIVSALPFSADPIQQQWLWVIIDILLTLGLIGIYVARAEKLGFLGLASFAVAMAALSFIGGPDADPFGFSTYEQGAMTLVIALIGLSLAWLRANERPRAPPLLWFASALAAGVIAQLPAPMPDYAFTIAGILFGAGFVFAGLPLLRR